MATGSGRVATWTVLFTDMVASTEMRVRVGEEAFDRVRADLDRRITLAVAAHAGAAVKSTGDGVMTAFAATASALRCATAIEGAVADHNRQTGDGVALRVGISVGDAVVDGGDLQGTAVVEAARLCAVAEPGTVLCSEAVRSVSANRSGCVFGEARSVELKGLPVPVVVHEVVAAPSTDRSAGRGLSLRVLGPLEIERDGRAVAVGGPKERLVLGVLLAGAGTVVSVDGLVDAVWGERPPRTAERTIHAYMARLRRALEPRHQPGGTQTVIETVGRGYRLAIDLDQLDAGRFEQVARSGADQLRAGDAATALRAALAEWRGDAYVGLADVGPCATEATRLESLRLTAVEDRVDADLATGQAAALVAEVEAAVAAQPFRERRWGQLMVALYRSGRQGDALAAYQSVRRVLVDELGVEPAQGCAAWRRRSSTRTPTSTGRRAARGRPNPGGYRWLWPLSARRSWDENARSGGCSRRGRLPRAATAGSSRSSAPRAPARRAWSPSSPGRRTARARWCCTGGATTHTRVPGRWSIRHSAAPVPRSDGSTPPARAPISRRLSPAISRPGPAAAR